MLLVIMTGVYLPAFIDIPDMTIPELKSILIGEKITDGSVPYTDLVDSTPPLTSWVYGFVDLLFGRSLLARHILAFVLIFLQSVYLGLVFINRKVFAENTYIPSLLFCVLHFFSFDNHALTGELLGATFLLFALNNLLREMEFRTQQIHTLLNLGLYVSVASLFSFAYVVFLPAVLIIVLIYSRRNVRSFLLLLTGFALPHVLLCTFYLLADETSSLWNFYYLPNLAFHANRYMDGTSLLWLGALPLFYFLISFVVLNSDCRFTKYQSQLVQIMSMWMIFSVVQIFYAKNLRPQTLIPMLPALAFYLTHFLLLIRRKRFVELNFWILFLGVISISYFSRYGYIKQVRYENLIVKSAEEPQRIKNKNLLVLKDAPSYYLQNTLATSFLNWELSQHIFSSPEYYENVLRVSKQMESDPPEVILDPDEYMPPFFERLPKLKLEYELIAPGEYHRR